jgi:hypothetical protein
MARSGRYRQMVELQMGPAEEAAALAVNAE